MQRPAHGRMQDTKNINTFVNLFEENAMALSRILPSGHVALEVIIIRHGWRDAGIFCNGLHDCFEKKHVIFGLFFTPLLCGINIYGTQVCIGSMA